MMSLRNLMMLQKIKKKPLFYLSLFLYLSISFYFIVFSYFLSFLELLESFWGPFARIHKDLRLFWISIAQVPPCENRPCRAM